MNDEFAYAEPTTRGMPGFSAGSLASSVPSSTFRRRLVAASEVTRILSTVGLKSNPKKRPAGAGVTAGPSETAMPVRGLTR